MKEFAWIAVIAGAVMLEVLTAPGSSLNGQSWQMTRSSAPGMVHFTVSRSRPGSSSVESSDLPLASFRDFSPDRFDHSGPVKFEYHQDAGSLLCQGKFAWGRGSGSYTLKPDADFVGELNRLGFASPNENELFQLMLLNVGLDFAREVQSANIGASLRDLIDMRSHGVTLAYVRDLSRSGFHNFRARDFIDFHDHGVKSLYVEELRQAGYDLTADQIIDLEMHGVRSDYVRDLGLSGARLRENEIVELHMHGVNPQYLHAFTAAGYSGLHPDEFIDLHQHGVSADLAREAHDLGYRFTTSELIDLSMHGVNGAYLRRLHDSGMHSLTEPQITQLHMHGVD